VRRLHAGPGDSAAVFGGGPVGNLAAQWLRLRGCSPVFVVDIDPPKLAAAESMGLLPVDGREADPAAAIERATGGGARRVVEAVGLPLTCRQALQAAGRFAEVLFIGNLQGELRLGEKDFSAILRRELVLYGTWNSKMVPLGEDDWSVTLDHLGGRLQAAPLIGRTPGLAEGPEVFRRLAEGSLAAAGRIVFRVTEEPAGPPPSHPAGTRGPAGPPGSRP
jgi:L-iditol 2-dehydrogenase/galactitol-1-phosphate 5-dehydrogenase